jgi:hypothetical protein
MKKLSYLVLALGLAVGCNKGDKKSDKAADEVVDKQKDLDKQVDKDDKRADETHGKADALARANARFNDRKEIRLIGLRSEQSMIAPQGDMIGSLAAQLPLTDDARKHVDEKLDALSQRLGEADAKITALQNATADEWKTRDDAAGEAMKNLETARDDAWHAFKKAKRTDGRSS